jgi:hypothetical protein
MGSTIADIESRHLDRVRLSWAIIVRLYGPGSGEFRAILKWLLDSIVGEATEEVIGTDERIPTQIYNGYGEFVAQIYQGLESEPLFT